MDLQEFLTEWHHHYPLMLVHTSGSTGRPKPMWVEKRRMEASARITCDFLGLHRGDTALLCMPLDYIAGKMMVVRSLVCGLRLLAVEPSGSPLATVTEPLDFAAMVPMQVWNSLQVPDLRKRLMDIRHLIIGGGAIDENLSAELRSFPHAVWSTYGMTETLSHIALRRLSGPDASDWYTPFEGVSMSLAVDGCLVIDAPAVHDGLLTTHDMAELTPDGRFKILGRKDCVICSGGLKIHAEEVERHLSPHLCTPYLLTKRKDDKFGEVTVLLTEGDTATAQAVCQRVLPKYWQPRAYVHVDRIPMTATGKLARKAAEDIVSRQSCTQ